MLKWPPNSNIKQRLYKHRTFIEEAAVCVPRETRKRGKSCFVPTDKSFLGEVGEIVMEVELFHFFSNYFFN